MFGLQLAFSIRSSVWYSSAASVRKFSCTRSASNIAALTRCQRPQQLQRQIHWPSHKYHQTLPVHPDGIICTRSISCNRSLRGKEDKEQSWRREASVEENQEQEDEESNEAVMADLSPEQLEELTGGDPELKKKIKFIQMEHELLRQDGRQVPSVIKFKRWRELLHLDSRSQRQKYFLFLWKTEMKSLADKRKKEELQRRRREELGAMPPRPTDENDPHGMFYGLNRNTIFLRLYDTRVNCFYHNRVIQSMQFGVPLVIDCGYDEHMTLRESKNCAAQLELLLTDNRTHPDPLNITLCNADPQSKMIQSLKQRIPILYEPEYAVKVTEMSYLDLFPKERLVYLTPHGREELNEFNEDEIYIVGAMVDKTDPRPLSLAKSKKEGIRMKKLPLDRYMDWGLGGKSLTINQMGNIMLDLRYTRDWQKALRFVPQRKLRRYEEPEDKFGSRTPLRRESQSQVLTDFELAKKRKGFRNNSSYDNNYSGSGRPSQKTNVKTILSDY